MWANAWWLYPSKHLPSFYVHTIHFLYDGPINQSSIWNHLDWKIFTWGAHVFCKSTFSVVPTMNIPLLNESFIFLDKTCPDCYISKIFNKVQMSLTYVIILWHWWFRSILIHQALQVKQLLACHRFVNRLCSFSFIILIHQVLLHACARYFLFKFNTIWILADRNV